MFENESRIIEFYKLNENLNNSLNNLNNLKIDDNEKIEIINLEYYSYRFSNK